MGAEEVSKTLVNFYQTAQCSILEDTVCHRVYIYFFYCFMFVLIIFMFWHYKCQPMALSQLRTN